MLVCFVKNILSNKLDLVQEICFIIIVLVTASPPLLTGSALLSTAIYIAVPLRVAHSTPLVFSIVPISMPLPYTALLLLTLLMTVSVIVTSQ
jgi:hypothetical protein